MASVQEGGGTGPVCLPRRAETFGGFDSHQMHCNKSKSAALPWSLIAPFFIVLSSLMVSRTACLKPMTRALFEPAKVKLHQTAKSNSWL